VWTYTYVLILIVWQLGFINDDEKDFEHFVSKLNDKHCMWRKKIECMDMTEGMFMRMMSYIWDNVWDVMWCALSIIEHKYSIFTDDLSQID